jgi:hypothetical protein
VLGTMESEIDMAMNAPDKLRQFYMQKYGNASISSSIGTATAAPTATTGFTGRTAVNKTTGARLRETSDGKWVP